MSTTLVLQPDDYTNITFDAVLPVGGPESGAVTAFQIELSSLRFYEEQRVAVEYAAYQYREGGEVGSTSYPLVPVEFTCRVNGLTGATIAAQLADLLVKSSQLKRAIYNSDGYFKYKPDGLAAGVLDTYYRYLRSVPPAPTSGEKSYWGMIAATSEPGYEDGIPYRVFTVRLMTMPVATSDPTSPVSVLSATTLNNIGDGTNDYVTITDATVKGDMPALTRLIAHPLTAGASAAIGTLWLARRTSGLASFTATYLTSTANAPTAAWSTVVDASRCGGSYYCCTPTACDIVYSRRYTISNWASHRGRAAVLVVVRNNGMRVSDFDIYCRWPIANVALESDPVQTGEVQQWEALLLGEIDLPETEMSAQEALDLYIDVCVVCKNGTGTFDLDAVKLLFTDEAAVQVEMPAGYGVDNDHSFLLENFDEEIAHTVVHATSKLAYICNLYGDMVLLEPDADNRIDVAWNRYTDSDEAFSDDFSDYDAYWRQLADFETDESWTVGTVIGTQRVVEGTYSLQYDQATFTTELTLDSILNLQDDLRFDWVYIWKQSPTGATQNVTVTFYSDSTNYYSATAAWVTGSNYEKIARASFAATGSPSWAGISKIGVTLRGGAGWKAIDDLQIVMADPDDASVGNPCGSVWNLSNTDRWKIHAEDGRRVLSYAYSSLGDSGVAEWTGNTGVTDARIEVKVRRTEAYSAIAGGGGLVFRKSGAATYYSVTAHPDSVRLYRSGGVVLLQSVDFDVRDDEWYYIGVLVVGSDIDVFFAHEDDYSSLWDNPVISTTDATHSSGSVGVKAVNGTVQFTDFAFASLGDRHVPTDQLQLSAYALFRTIYPFGES